MKLNHPKLAAGASTALAVPIMAILVAEVWRMAHGRPPIPPTGIWSWVFPIGIAGFFAVQSIISITVLRGGMKRMDSTFKELIEARDRFVRAEQALNLAHGSSDLLEALGLREPPEPPPTLN